jgi:hypothetical protein
MGTQNHGDTATWANLSPKSDDLVRQILVEHRPEHVQQFDFPKDGNKKFSTSHRTRRLANAEEMRHQ